MSKNISKEKREELLREIGEIREYLEKNTDENAGRLLTYLANLEKDVDGKKYGLVFEEHEEAVDVLCRDNVPILKEVAELKIDNGGTQNFLIEGDNLASLKLLEKTHTGKIDLIYIDPPYNTGNKDFIYDDTFVGKDDKYRHSKWLSFIKKRLSIAQRLLSGKGVILISIDDKEQSNLKILCDSIFGEQNFLTMFVRKTKSMTGDDGNGLNIQHESLLVYANNKAKAIFKGAQKTFDNYSNPDNDPNGIWTSADPSAKSGGESTYFPINNPITGQVDYPPKGRFWAFSQDTMNKYIESGRIKFKDQIKKNQRGFVFKRYAEIMEVTTHPVCTLCFDDNAYMNSVATSEMNELIGAGKFSYPKPVCFIKDLVKFASSKYSIILDFFAGSGTTGHAVMKLNTEDGGYRKFIICTNNENNICKDIAYERIKRVIEKENYQACLKYMQVDFIPINEQLYYEYADKLLLHIKELVELENGLDFEDNNKVAICLTDEDLLTFANSINDGTSFESVYVGHDVLLTAEIEGKLLKANIKINVIPDYYYGELRG